MSLFTTYSTANRQILAGKTQRITVEPVGDPITTVEAQTGGTYKVETAQWYKSTCVCSAKYQYVGMTYDAASACAEAMRQKWTRDKTIWKYECTVDDTTKMVEYTWKESTTGARVLDSEISLEYVAGNMWQVTVMATTTDVKLSTTGATTWNYPSQFNDIP